MTAFPRQAIIEHEPEVVRSESFGINDPVFYRTFMGIPGTIATWSNSSNYLVPSFPISPISENLKLFIQRILSFRELPANWDSYGAQKAGDKAVENSVDFILRLANYNRTIYYVASGPNGEILVELRNGGRSAEIYFDEDGTDEVLLIKDKDHIFEGPVSQNFNKIIRFIATGEIE